MSTVSFHESIKYYRKFWGLTREQFAEQLDVVPLTLLRWENGIAQPRKKNLQKLAPYLRIREDTMDRRDFFRKALDISLTFAAPSQLPDLRKLAELVSPASGSLSIEEEFALVEALVKSCWQLLPHQASIVNDRHLDFVRSYREKLESWLETSPGSSSLKSRLEGTVSEIMQIEGGLLYALKRPDDAKCAYNAAIALAKQAHKDATTFAKKADNVLLEAIGLTWLANVLIDTHKADLALAPVAVAEQRAKDCGATPLVRAWIAATEADAWANNQREKYEVANKCQKALDRATEMTLLVGIEQERYPVPYDYPWLFGYRGTAYAHIGRPQEAQDALMKGLKELGTTNLYRTWGFFKDLIIAHSIEKNVDEACDCARQAINIAEQTKALMFLQRTQDTTQQFLRPWKNHQSVKSIMEELQVAQRKLE